MKITRVEYFNKDFKLLCKNLEDYQFALLPVLKQKDYSLTQNLQDILPFVMYEGDIPIGCIGIKKISNEVCEIVRVFVSEKHRRKGCSLKLFDTVEEYAKNMGFKRAELVVWSDAKPAVALYKKLGYTLQEEKTSEWYGKNKYIEFFKIL